MFKKSKLFQPFFQSVHYINENVKGGLIIDKQKADLIITEYYKKLYGFALSKTACISEAEELASRITLEVYSSLLKADGIANINGYIYRIACNVYAKYVDERKGCSHLAIDTVSIPVNADFTKDIVDAETVKNLRREIAYLSEIQRKIVVMHYYDNLKLAEIADRLSLPLGTVKWHLYEAKNSLKEGINMKRTPGTLGINPIKLVNMGHSGCAGSKGDTADFLKNSLTQNIAYAAYYQPKTVAEIAEELGVSPIFIEDEVRSLEEYGFLDKLPGGRYRTNIYIRESSKETDEKLHLLHKEYADIICKEYIPSVFDAMKKLDRSRIYIPDDDFNFLMWAAVTLAVGKKTMTDFEPDFINKYRIKRKDGGDYIAVARVEENYDVSFDRSRYATCGDMSCGSLKYNVKGWQFNTFYDNRKGNWRDNPYTDYDYLYEHITGKIKKDEASLEKYRRLFDKGYLIGDKVNVIVTTFSLKDFFALLPCTDEKLSEKLTEFNEKYYELTKNSVSPHIQPLHKASCQFMHSDNRMRATVLEQLVETGVLRLPTEEQKCSLNTILFCDKLPE